jgi:predicted enzyme related to lactoylglutathione lyase
MPVPTMGYFAQAMDTEGNVFAIWQSDPQAK